MKATVDKTACIGCGLCAADCPEVFTMNEDNIADAIPGIVPAELKESCRLAAQNCPVEAIKISE
ncbi:MAG: ferredoxin [Chitinispirillaceae bacterium]|nr:ferredoxin [Chitinispirillaceae bacterium]